ncbi:quinate permease [Plectosphaerella plurivora]|uniref:Quinate permease n=1 Tax=Plectosphaerella plurivora TaxID=936078 RepID=A0A9P9AEQ9_9PEZI|nr:quinate permease [Plectosphaerella plurivora]
MVNKTMIYNWYCSLLAAMCMVLYGYDASVFNAVQGSTNWFEWVNLDKDKDTQMIGLINTSYTVGAIVAGFFLGGPTADFFGRRAGMFLGCALTIVATMMQAFTPHHKIGVFIAGRVIIGIGQGLALTAAPVYIGEITPANIRGKVMTCWQMNYSIGSFIAFWINYACAKQKVRLGNWDWRMVVIFQALVPAIVCSAIFFIPESPRWYIQKNDNVEGARASLRRIRATEEEVEEELTSIRGAIEYEKEAIGGVTYTALFKDPSVRKRMYLAFVLNVGQQLTGQGTLNSYSTSIYKKVWPNPDTINLINALNATFGILFTLNAMWTSDRYGRRWLLLVGAAGMATCMLIVPTLGITTPTKADGTKSESVSIGIVFMFFLFAFFYKPSWGATVWMWTSEVFSMNIRAQAVGMCSQMQNVANTVFQQFFPTFLKNEGLRCLYFFMAINVCLFAFVWFLIPETKQIALEEIDVLFGGSSHAEKGTDMLGNHVHNTDIRAANDAAFEVKDGATVQQTEAKKQSV